MNIIVGTAGHIDHGKTTLIKALTGTDTDRLPEEKKRGITIDLGFAELNLGEHRIGFVDVPGHERFVKNMLAGASGIDLVMLIVAADEGVMPQTREHFDICRLLGVAGGIIAITKKDMVDEEMLDLVRLDVSELVDGSFLADAPAIAVSSTTGEGIDELEKALVEMAGRVAGRRDDQVVRMAVDRSFTVKGFGTVVTGTLASGEIREGDELELMPVHRKVRVRGLQTHGLETASASAGQRVAVNLAGVDQMEAARGMTLSEPGAARPVHVIDARVEVLKTAARPLRSRQRVRVHIGTAEVLARVRVLDQTGEIAPGSTDVAQLRFEAPVAAVIGEKFIVRSYSPPATIAGGTVLDVEPKRHRRAQFDGVRLFLDSVAGSLGDDRHLLELFAVRAGEAGLDLQRFRQTAGWRNDVLEALARDGRYTRESGSIFTHDALASPEARLRDAVEAHHERDPLSPGVSRESLRSSLGRVSEITFQAALKRLEKAGALKTQRDVVSSAAHISGLYGEDADLAAKLTEIYQRAGLEPPKTDEAVAAAGAGTKDRERAARLLQYLTRTGQLTKVSADYHFSAAVITALTDKVRHAADAIPGRVLDVAKFKEIAGVSRKYAIPLLEYFDSAKVTVRAGNNRVVL